MHQLVRSELESIRPTSRAEQAHIEDALRWVDSGLPLCRIAKPATPPKHLVSYFPVVDGEHILLVDHKNAMRWLPPGGHVEPDEDPRSTVVRELHEELGLVINRAEVGAPLMVSVTQTVGLTGGHIDVSLWYVVERSRSQALTFDAEEFNGIRWFHFDEVPFEHSDPHLRHFIAKLQADASPLYRDSPISQP